MQREYRRLLPALTLFAVTACAQAAIDAPRQKELLRLLHSDCGSCHGLTLNGGLGPALTPAALAGKPAEFLSATVLDGRPGTPMPPWRPFLSVEEVNWLVGRLQQEDGHGAH